MKAGTQISTEDVGASLDYSRRLYSTVVDWYKTAETKAQVLLSLDGIIVSLLLGSLFREQQAVRGITGYFGLETWIAVASATVCMACSIVSALMCLISRMMPRAEVRRRYADVLANPDRGQYPPEMMWFFQTISELDETRYAEEALHVTGDIENRAIISQNFVLAGKVVKKHIWINRGFAFAALSLVSLLLSGGSYIIRVA